MHPGRIFLTSLALGLALWSGLPARGAEPLAVGQPFPDLRDFSLQGALPDLTRAKVVIVDFWASWCAPCKASFPVYDALQREFASQGVVIIAVNVDRREDLMKAFLKKQSVSFTLVRDAETKLVSRVNVPAMPTAFVLDAQGVVRFIHTGFHGEETRRQYLEQINHLLQETP